MLRVGVVGMGQMGSLHADVLRGIEGVEVVGFVEPNDARRAAEATRLGVDGHTTLEQLLPRVDAVSVCTPDDAHAAPVVAALKAGVSVLVEKPLAISSHEGQTMLDARHDPKALMVGQMLRFDSRVIQAKRIIDSGVLGRLRYVRAHRANTLWAGNKLGSRSSVGWFLGVHDVDLILWLTGAAVESVSASAERFVSENWDVVSATLHLSGGLLAQVENHWLIPDEWNSGFDAGIRLIGEEGMLDVDLGAPEIELTTQAQGRPVRQDSHYWPTDKVGPGGALRAEIESWITTIRTGATPAVTGEEALRTIEAVELIHTSIETSQTRSRRR